MSARAHVTKGLLIGPTVSRLQLLARAIFYWNNVLSDYLLISGSVRNLSPVLWRLSHLTCLYLNDNCLARIPPEIQQLAMLRMLDLSCNQLRSLPAELGELIYLR